MFERVRLVELVQIAHPSGLLFNRASKSSSTKTLYNEPATSSFTLSKNFLGKKNVFTPFTSSLPLCPFPLPFFKWFCVPTKHLAPTSMPRLKSFCWLMWKWTEVLNFCVTEGLDNHMYAGIPNNKMDRVYFIWIPRVYMTTCDLYKCPGS